MREASKRRQLVRQQQSCRHHSRRSCQSARSGVGEKDPDGGEGVDPPAHAHHPRPVVTARLRQLLVRRRKLARKFKVIYLNLNEPFLETSVTGLGAFLKFLVTNFPTKVAQICGERFGLF